MALNREDDNGATFRLIPTALASSTAASLARIPVHPIDSIKSIIQASKVPISIAEVLRQNSVWNLYRGLGIALIGSIPAGALYFTTYEATAISFRSPILLNVVPLDSETFTPAPT